MEKVIFEHGKIPPQAVDIEEFVLGSMMSTKKALKLSLKLLTKQVFYKDQHKTIFDAIEQMAKSNESVDILTVTNKLKQLGTLEESGGAYYISELTSRVGSTVNINEHCSILHQKFIKRELISRGSELIQNGYDDSLDPFILIKRLTNDLSEIGKLNGKQSKFDYKIDSELPQFPIEVFPANIQTLINELDSKSGFEPQIISGALLFVISTIIGNSRRIKVKTTWIDTPNLWISIVGRRGTMKTPAVNYILKPLVRDEKRYDEDFQAAMRVYLAVPKKERDEADRPKRVQRYSNDPTVEGLIKAMSENPNGMGIYKDELNGFFEEMNRYKSGGNLEFYLSAFNGGQYIKNRMSYDPITVNDVFLTMLGGIQPEVLKRISGQNIENGMIDRWLYIESYNRIPNTTLEDIPDGVTEQYDDFICKIRNYKTDAFIDILKWEPEALQYFIERINIMESMMAAEDCEDALFTYLSKMKTYSARLIVIIAAMYDMNTITLDISHKAALLTSYFLDTAERTFIGFENRANIEIIFTNENAQTKRQRVFALKKHLPDLNNTELAKAVPCSRRYVIDTLKRNSYE